MRYRIDTSAMVNASAMQGSGVRNPGRHTGWLQVKNGLTIREFAYDKAQAHDSSSLAPGAGWSFTTVAVSSVTASTAPVAAVFFNKAHDEQTRAEVISWLSDKFK